MLLLENGEGEVRWVMRGFERGLMMDALDSGLVAWILTSSALVMLMTPGLALFYGGLVRRKNAVNALMLSFVSLGVASIVWVLWGYSIAFGDDIGGIFGNPLQFFGFRGVSESPTDIGASDSLLFAIFQLMFAVITPALITGAIVERFKFMTYLVFLVLWVTFVYAPIAHWVWGGGWISSVLPAPTDFAGGMVVHVNAGVAAVVAAYLVGRRRNLGGAAEPHNVPYVMLGAALLWFGWFGFNAGSAFAADTSAIRAFAVTHVAASASLLVWLVLMKFRSGRIGLVGVATGAVAGLVAITPAAGNVGVLGSMGIGAGAGLLTYIAVQCRQMFKFDDALDVFAVHGIGGIWGALGTGIFDLEQFFNWGIIYSNIVATLGTLAWSAALTFVILKILDKVPALGLRSSIEEEDAGLDIPDHGERAYVSDGAD